MCGNKDFNKLRNFPMNCIARYKSKINGGLADSKDEVTNQQPVAVASIQV